MPFINPNILDNLGSIAAQATRRVDVCKTAEPTTYTEATSTNTVGNETGITTGSIVAGAVDGRRELFLLLLRVTLRKRTVLALGGD